VSSRTYLSIGDVLTLLREEFPDVTISKIRFLESQGLVNPERSPSGYRKFFETDVERLRWVLRQQREHFLPLKVIRDRLADGDLSEGGADDQAAGAVTHINGRVPEPAHAGAPGTSPSGPSGGSGGSGGSGRVGGLGPGRGGSRGGGTHAPAPPGPGQTQADDEAMARILADASRRAARVSDEIAPSALLHAVPDPGAPAPPEHGVAAGSVAPAGSAGSPGSAGSAGSAAPEQAPPVAAEPTPPTPPAPAAVPEPSRGPSHAAAVVRDEPSAAPAAATAAETAGSASSAGTPAAAAAWHESPDQTGAAGPGAAESSAKTTRAHAPARAAAPVTPPAPAAEARVPEPRAAARDGGVSGASAKPAGAPSEKRVAAMGGQAAQTTTGMVTGASLTAQELCAASGLSEVELAGLQGFGLLEPVLVAGIPTYDEDDLTVANLAAEFRKYGIEARHLRPYRNAVDREVGLIEQVIIPLLRQRNPESRQRAIDAADELGALGQTMRATLMRTALKRHVGG
jgi:DNA-binding transcriptional MerR regulator